MLFHVRPMQSDDVNRVYAIEVAAHRAPWGHKIISDCISVGYDCRVLEFGQENEKEIVSYIICRYQGNVGHILNLCVDSKQQGKGYGRSLLQNLIDSLSDSDIHTLLLEVRPSNVSAINLYQNMGFHQVGFKKEYYCDESGADIMTPNF